jgi:hypothetical protein
MTTPMLAVRPLAAGASALMMIALFGTAPCSAQDVVTLSQLIGNDGLIIHGDKQFDDFSYSFTGDMPGPEAVNVVPIEDMDANLGIQFQGSFTDLFSSQGGSDALIRFRVTVLDPAKRISDAHLFGNPELLGATGSISVTETFTFDVLGEHQMSIFEDETAGSLNADWTEFSPRNTLQVTKDISAIAGATGTVTLSFIDQTFSQIDIPIPEATAGSLMLIGLICLAGMRFVRRHGRGRS